MVTAIFSARSLLGNNNTAQDAKGEAAKMQSEKELCQVLLPLPSLEQSQTFHRD